MPEPLVSIVMGSDSDWPTMEAAADALDGLAVTLRGDATDVYLDADGRQIVHAARDWLAWHATHDGIDPATDVGPIQP